MRTQFIRKEGSSTVRLEIGKHFAELNTSDVDALIEQLSAVRAVLQPAVPAHVSRRRQYAIEIDPCWYAEPHPASESVVLFLRDTGAGWAGFAIPRTGALRLRDGLARYIHAAEARLGLPN
jgi:hypothetical protein